MRMLAKPLLDFIAADLMTPNVVQLPGDTPLREAAQRLLHAHISGAPVVDAEGKCIGVLTAQDYLRLSVKWAGAGGSLETPLPSSCSLQVKHETADGREWTLCSLMPGMCPLQAKEHGPAGEDLLVCGQPHGVLVDWQMVDVEKLPTDAVSRFMIPNPVTAPASTPIRILARMMIDAHIHRIIVVDEEKHPVGVISATDLLAALAYADDDVHCGPI